MEGVLFIIIVFGGGMLWMLAKTPMGLALAERIRGPAVLGGADPALLEAVQHLRQEVSELQERMDFAERLLAQKREAGQLGES